MKILLADDDKVVRTMVRGLLTKAGYDVVVADTGDSALAAAQALDGPVLLVLDWVMPGLSGPEVIQRLARQAPDAFRYTILLTMRRRASDLVIGLDSGADDYVRKPCDPQELVARVRVGERMLAMQSRLAATNSALVRLAHIDTLTEIRNRRSVLQALRELGEQCQARSQPLGLAMLDIDHFKQINDVYGHPTGDVVLRIIAGRLSARVREPGVIGRYGGEEFLVVLPDTGPVALAHVGRRLLQAVHSDPVACPKVQLAVTTSVGLACRLPGQDILPCALLKSADEALYRAKRTGRNRVCMAWEPEVPSQAAEHAA